MGLNVYRDRDVFFQNSKVHDIRHNVFSRYFILQMLKIGIVVDPPYVIRNEDSSGRYTYEGLFIDLLVSHSSILGFDYELVESPDGFYGLKQDNGHFNGVVGLMERGEVDLIYCVAMTTDRQQVLQYTQAVKSAGTTCLTNHEPPSSDIVFKCILLVPPTYYEI